MVISLHCLSDKQQEQFLTLGALPTELNIRAAHLFALWAEDDATALDNLVAEGLLTPVPDRDEQYTQHRLLRAYARGLLRKKGRLHEVEQRHCKYLLKLADRAFGQPRETWKQLDDDLPQIHALGNELAARIADADHHIAQDEKLRVLSQTGIVDMLPDLLESAENFAAAIYTYIAYRYVGTEGRRWLWAGLAAARARNARQRVSLFTDSLGSWHNAHGDPQAALPYFEQSLQADIELGDKLNQAATLTNIGKVYRTLDNMGQALTYFRQALPLHIEVGDKDGQAATLNHIGTAYYGLNRVSDALTYFRQALPLRIEVGDKNGQATTLNNIGSVYNFLGEWQQALTYFQQALPLCIEVNDKHSQAATLNNIGLLYRTRGDEAQAFIYYQRALSLFVEVGDPSGESTSRSNMALILWERGEYRVAIDLMRQARDLKARIGVKTADEDSQLQQWRDKWKSD